MESSLGERLEDFVSCMLSLPKDSGDNRYKTKQGPQSVPSGYSSPSSKTQYLLLIVSQSFQPRLSCLQNSAWDLISRNRLFQNVLNTESQQAGISLSFSGCCYFDQQKANG